MNNLFEYQNKIRFQGNYSGLEIFLDEIWNKREKNNFYEADDFEKNEVQRFIQFIHKTKELKSNKYVGVIHFEGERINLLPKIFYDNKRIYKTKEINAIQQHILWYLSYCRKIKFPNFKSSAGSMKNDFFEILIYLFSKYTRELLTSSIFQQYEEVQKEISNIRGRLNTPVYISENLSKGRWHKISCTYDSFIMDNKFNRIIKYVCQILFNVTKNIENKKYLREILFILDDVTNERACANECRNIKFNPLYSNFQIVRDYCTLFLSSSISINYKNDLKLFAFLLPMEYLFEDFIFGFIQKEIKSISARSQISSVYLDDEKIFGLKPDLYIETPDKKFIADTKYKIAYSNPNDIKNGISQNDLYQMTAYAIRFDIENIVLLYPNMLISKNIGNTNLKISDKLAFGKKINISSYQVPVINFELFENESDFKNFQLSELFKNQVKELKKKLCDIFELETC
jgi:5-methylcytosine-specific restriction enzyme subunit McrC